MCGVFLVDVRLAWLEEAVVFDHFGVAVGFDCYSRPVLKVVECQTLPNRYMNSLATTSQSAHMNGLQPGKDTDRLVEKIYMTVFRDREHFPSNQSSVFKISRGYEVSVNIGPALDASGKVDLNNHGVQIWMVLRASGPPNVLGTLASL